MTDYTGCICPKPALPEGRPLTVSDWTILEDCQYHAMAFRSPFDHSIPWNCPTYYDGCNCRSSVDELHKLRAENAALQAEMTNVMGRSWADLRKQNAALVAALEAARAWDECPDTMPMDEMARIRGEFDAALASVEGEQG